jgi:hypothetical protein
VYHAAVAAQAQHRATDESQGGNTVRVRKQTAIARPIARTEGLLIESVGEETVVYDLDTKEAHCLKALAATVFMYADGARTAADIAELSSYRLETSVSEADVKDAVKQLESVSLIETPLVVRDGMSRRDAIKRFGTIAGVATATPLIASVMAPAAYATQSLVETGGCCGHRTTNCTGGNPICQSNHCCQNLSSKDCNQCKCVGDKNDCSVDQCITANASQCPPITVNGVLTQPCGKKSGQLGGSCCYPDFNGECCTVIINSAGQDVAC